MPTDHRRGISPRKWRGNDGMISPEDGAHSVAHERGIRQRAELAAGAEEPVGHQRVRMRVDNTTQRRSVTRLKIVGRGVCHLTAHRQRNFGRESPFVRALWADQNLQQRWRMLRQQSTTAQPAWRWRRFE